VNWEQRHYSHFDCVILVVVNQGNGLAAVKNGYDRLLPEIKLKA